MILRLISPFRIFRQLDCYISLTHHFLNRNRFEAGCQVANRISDILSKLSTEQASFLRPDQAGQYSSFIFSLELKSRAADEERLENYFAFYRKLNFAMKCQVLTDLKEHQKTSTSAKIFQEMTEVALIDTFTHESLDSAGLPIVKIALCLDNQDLHHRLITRIYEEKDESRRCNIVTRILKFLNPAELALYTESGLVVLSQLLEINIGTLTSQYAKFCNSDGSTLSEDHDPDFRSDLYSIVRLIMLMENDERCMNSSRVTKMGNVLYCLPLTAICHLIQDLRATDGEELRKHPRSCNMFFDLCQLIGLRRREFIAKLPPAMIVELLESFIWFGDLHLAGGLIRLINFEEPKNTWNQLEISSLLSVIMHTSDLWQYLVPSSSPFVCRTVNSLLGTWMMNLNQRLNELLLDDKDNLNLIQLRDPILKEAATCLSFYVRNSLKFPEDAYVNTNLVSLINLLSPLEVAHLITQIREANTVYLKIYKPKKKTAFHVFLLICTQLTNADLHDLVQSCNDALFRAVTCAFWVGIEELLIALVRRITSALPHSQENVFVCKVLASAEIRKLAEKSASNREAFYQLVEHRIDWLNFLCAIEPTKDQTTQLDAVTGHQEALRELEELCALLQNFQEPSEDTPMLCNDETEVNENYIQENSSERNTES